MEKIGVFFRMISQIIKGKYKANQWNFLIGIFSIIYVISPIDLIPEFPFVFFGLLDDAAIIAFAYSRINKEIENFVQWESQNESTQ